MVFGSSLFRGCRSSSDDAVASMSNADKRTTASGDCDDSWSSERSKADILDGLASKADWDAVIELVNSSKPSDWRIDSNNNNSNNNSGSNGSSSSSYAGQHLQQQPLHVALQYRAPLRVVERLIALSKDKLDVAVPEEATDARGRTPLHIAVATGCPEEVVQLLLAGDNLLMPAIVRDCNGQIPLHAATASPIVKVKKQSLLGPNQTALDHWNKRRVISVLLDHYPEGATLMDAAGKTPVQYACEQKLQKYTMYELQRIATIHAPNITDPVDAASHKDLASLASSDIPLIVPSPNGSTCGPLTTESIKNNIEALLKQDSLLQMSNDNESPGVGVAEGDDVSSLGDGEAELYHIEFEETIHASH